MASDFCARHRAHSAGAVSLDHDAMIALAYWSSPNPPLPAVGPPPTAPMRFPIMSTDSENWIPFVPVHVDGDNR
jgi:hypothetical protein